VAAKNSGTEEPGQIKEVIKQGDIGRPGWEKRIQ
jgi:hypothetical protein